MKIGLYVHIPFCKSKCYYCDFLSFPKLDLEEEYTEALTRELIGYANTIKGVHTISSIFIGGGTPTVLSPFLLGKICETIKKQFEIEKDAEWTIEANPGTISDDHIKMFVKQGVNRVSLGLQACQSHLLKKIGRIHTLQEWEETVKALKQAGIENINTDVMFGLPEQSVEEWKETLAYVMEQNPTHISAYSLIVEEGTVFYKLMEQGKLNLPCEEDEREMYELTKSMMKEKGYEHYEISNWSKPNQECKHNILYWQQGSYIGAGLGAHGFIDDYRYHNTCDLDVYIKANGNCADSIEEKEFINEKMAIEEFMFLGLRLTKGISSEAFEMKFNQSLEQVYGKTIDKWIKEKALVQDKERLYLSELGRDISNQVFTSFLLD